jgi:NAD(P)-dependent dehydrogenase (short-subunit alcohol dehydrogenase family)
MGSKPPALTSKWHSSSYPEISPARPELSTVDKTILITGGGTGIGAGIAHAFATAGSKQIALLGRRQSPLEETAQALEAEFPSLKVLCCTADVTNKGNVGAAFDSVVKEFGPIDVLISNAGYLPGAGNVSNLDLDDAWAAFETNTKGSFIVAQAFARTACKERAFVVDISTALVHMPPSFPGTVAYTASKLAATKIWSFFGAENKNMRVVSLQPGQIATDMSKKAGVLGRDDSKP